MPRQPPPPEALRKYVDLQDQAQMRDLVLSLDTTRAQIGCAVQEVGSHLEDVRAWLARRRAKN